MCLHLVHVQAIQLNGSFELTSEGGPTSIKRKHETEYIVPCFCPVRKEKRNKTGTYDVAVNYVNIKKPNELKR